MKFDMIDIVITVEKEHNLLNPNPNQSSDFNSDSDSVHTKLVGVC